MPYITPNSIPSASICGRLLIPDDIHILAAVKGAILELAKVHNWEQVGTVDAVAMATRMQEMYDDFLESDCNMIGTITHYVQDTPPSNILACDGSVYNRVDYPKLYAVLPAILILDADTFNTPLVEDAFLLGAGASYSHLANGGNKEITLSLAQMPNHSHWYDKPTFNVDVESVGVPDPTGVGQPFIPTTTSSVGSGEAHDNMPPYVAFNVGIMAK